MEDDLIDGTAEREAVAAAFAEQFAIDVSEIGDTQRKQLRLSTLGDNAFRTVVAIFIADYVPRVWAGFEALGMGKPGYGDVAWDHEADPIDALLNGFVPAVARLRAFDPVTTEVVRLRGAAQHNCRLCKSLREGHALDAGGTEGLYEQIERYESVGGPDRCAQGGAAVCRRVDLVAGQDRAGGGRRCAQTLFGGSGRRVDVGRHAQRVQQDRGVAGCRRAEGRAGHRAV